MRDHQQFERTVLSNGITLYTYQDNFRTVNLEILLPVGAGHSHSINGFLPGSAHFLEHVQLIRSLQFPAAYQLDRELGLKGGHGDGTTYPTVTSHWIDAPIQEQDFATEAFVDRIFHPLFDESDFETERTVIMNERNQRKFYPGKSAASQYYYTNFLSDTFYPLEQMFGSDSDLEKMDRSRISAMHRRVTSEPGITAIAVGPDNFSRLARLLEALPTSAPALKKIIEPTEWANREYSTAYFDSVSQPTLKVAWIHPRLDYAEYQAVSFILSLLINTTHGPLYRELREEKGWVYGLDGYCTQREQNCILGLTFPVNTKDQVEYIREHLADRIQSAVEDQQLVEHEIVRYFGNQVYNYQTAGEIISAASQDLICYGKIHTEKEWLGSIRAMADPAWRQRIVSAYFREEDMGAICFMPERRRMVPVREVAVPDLAVAGSLIPATLEPSNL